MCDEITYLFPSFNSYTVEVWEWISNFIAHFIMYVITFPCCDWSQSMLVKRANGVSHYSDYLFNCSWQQYKNNESQNDSHDFLKGITLSVHRARNENHILTWKSVFLLVYILQLECVSLLWSVRIIALIDIDTFRSGLKYLFYPRRRFQLYFSL